MNNLANLIEDFKGADVEIETAVVKPASGGSGEYDMGEISTATMPQSETMQRYDRARIANLTRQFNALRKEAEL